MCRLLVPLCAARAAEEVLYGRDSMTLSTASEVRRWPVIVTQQYQGATCRQIHFMAKPLTGKIPVAWPATGFWVSVPHARCRR